MVIIKGKTELADKDRLLGLGAKKIIWHKKLYIGYDGALLTKKEYAKAYDRNGKWIEEKVLKEKMRKVV